MGRLSKVTRQMEAESTFKRFRETYGNPENRSNKGFLFDIDGVDAKLSALTTPTPEAIIDIFGHDSWVKVECAVCDESVEEAILIDTGGYYGQMLVCSSCLEKAMAKLKAE